MLSTIIIFILVLSVLVFVHELGHFWTARKFGLKPKEFGFGFPPRAIGFYKNIEGKWKKVRGSKDVDDAADTIYSINWLPLGGFVSLGEDEAESDDPNHFVNQKPWKRSIILSAGVTMNVVLAAVLISIGLMIGFPQTTTGISSKAKISDYKVQVIEVLSESPAEQAGLEAGDVILSIDDNEFNKEEDIQTYVAEHTGEELNYKIERWGEEKTYKIVPEVLAETNEGGVGIAITTTGLVKYPWYLAIWEGVKMTLLLLWAIIVAFYELFKGIILGHGVSADLGGPVRIAEVTGQAARMGFVYLLQFSALLSLNLAVINFLPFPALDGGRVLFIIFEKIFRRPVKRELEATLHYIGFTLLMILVAIVTFRDVLRLFQ